MKNILTNPRSAAIISFLLALPLAVLFPIAVFKIEPFNGLFETLFTEADGYSQNTLGRIVTVGAMVCLVAACIVSLMPIVRNVRAGKSIMVNPINLLLAVAILLYTTFLLGSAIIDQIPCFMGVPNCD